MYFSDPKIVNLHRVFDQNERQSFLRLDLNENPGGLPEELIARALETITPQMVAQYPETRHFTERLANYLRIAPENLCLVNGSAEGIRYIIQAFTSENGKIVGVVPSYFMFQVYAEMYGRTFVKVPYERDLTFCVDRIIDALTDDTQLLVLLNPNNPMGNTYSDDEIERILRAAEEHQITVLIDEAYYYFHPKTFIDHVFRRKRVLITRTFSKLFSMAGCRLGYVIGMPEDIQMVQKLCTPHNVNLFSMRIAETVLDTPGAVEELVLKFREGRAYLISWLDANGYRHQGSAGNFLFIQPKTDAAKVVERMKTEKKILIKVYPAVGALGDCLRVSIGEKKYMQRFTEAMQELDC